MKAIRYSFILTLLLVTIAQAQTPMTNEQLMINTIADKAEELLDSLGMAKTVISLEPQTGLNSLVNDGFKAGALRYGLDVVNKNPKTDNYNVNVSVSAFNFTYKNGKSRGFFKRPYVKRELTGQMLINISGGDFNFLGFKDFSVADEIVPDEVNYISSLRYNQLSPNPPGGGAKKYLEPLAVTATVGGLIYLFFINR